MIHPDTELRFINSTMGLGVFATQLIPRGTITWVQDCLDYTFSREEFARQASLFRPTLDKYSFMGPDGSFVLCWDIARYVNHSCNPPCLSAGYDFEFAVRDIQAGEEITDDYGTLNMEEDFCCACNQPGCRKKILADDLVTYGDEWDAIIAEAFPLIAQVQQPMWNLVKEKDELEMIFAGKAPIASCRGNYYRGV